MSDSPIIPFPKPRAVTPSADQLVSRVHSLSLADSLNIRMSEPHFKQRMRERGINIRLVMEVLKSGRAVDRPEQDEFGDWRIKMRRKVAGQRVTVVVAVYADHIECITTW